LPTIIALFGKWPSNERQRYGALAALVASKCGTTADHRRSPALVSAGDANQSAYRFVNQTARTGLVFTEMKFCGKSVRELRGGFYCTAQRKHQSSASRANSQPWKQKSPFQLQEVYQRNLSFLIAIIMPEA